MGDDNEHSNLFSLVLCKSLNYKVKKAGNGLYAFVLYGSFELAGKKLNERDALGITDFDQFELKALTKDAEILLMEIPMGV